MLKRPLRSLLALFTAASLLGCVAVQAPLREDDAYPADWPRIETLGKECHGLSGTFMAEGVVALDKGETRSIVLTRVFNLPESATEWSLSVQTRKVDEHGDAFSTLVLVADGNPGIRHELTNCYCLKQTLACTQIGESYWSVPNFGLGGSQSNVYLSLAQDGSVVVKMRSYHADVVLGLPVYGSKDAWARFPAVKR